MLNYFLLIVTGSLIISSAELSSFFIFVFLSVSFLLFSMNSKSSLIRMLLILELLVLTVLFLICNNLSNAGASLAMLYILLILSVGEAVLGLSMLVRYSRFTSDKVSLGSI